MTSAEHKVPAIIRNEVFYAFARLCIVFLTVIGVPVGGFMLTRVVTAADDIRAQLQTQNTALILLTAEVKFRFANLEDHEHRLRKLELGAIR